MSYANGTTHYNLPQTVGTDKRDWFDTNDAFASVDSALHTASETASSAASDIVTLSGRVSDLETASGSQAQDIVDIKADILSQGGAITRLDGEIDEVKADALDMICAVDEGTAQVATVAVTAGNYFRYNDVLYIATANIGVGDTIVPNTNCTATNVATELQTILASFAIIPVKVANSLSTGTASSKLNSLYDAFTALPEWRKDRAVIRLTDSGTVRASFNVSNTGACQFGRPYGDATVIANPMITLSSTSSAYGNAMVRSDNYFNYDDYSSVENTQVFELWA